MSLILGEHDPYTSQVKDDGLDCKGLYGEDIADRRNEAGHDTTRARLGSA